MTISPLNSSSSYGADCVCRPNNETSRRHKKPDGKELSDEEQRQVQELKRRDTEVRNHEVAHLAAGGGYVRGGATYSYQTGPDGQRYAVGGEVSIDTSPEKTPEATIRKMQAVRQAAMAPAQPSGQDRAVAAAAAQQEAQARQELQEEDSTTGLRKDESQKDAESTESTSKAMSHGGKSAERDQLQHIDVFA